MLAQCYKAPGSIKSFCNLQSQNMNPIIEGLTNEDYLT